MLDVIPGAFVQIERELTCLAREQDRVDVVVPGEAEQIGLLVADEVRVPTELVAETSERDLHAPMSPRPDRRQLNRQTFDAVPYGAPVSNTRSRSGAIPFVAPPSATA